jgi:8-oxo-dGTP pyrophosphatase MutT (NUDIX family)
MANDGPGHYVVILLLVGSPNGSDVKLILQREPRPGKIWIRAGYVLSNEQPIDTVVRELFEKKG